MGEKPDFEQLALTKAENNPDKVTDKEFVQELQEKYKGELEQEYEEMI